MSSPSPIRNNKSGSRRVPRSQTAQPSSPTKPQTSGGALPAMSPGGRGRAGVLTPPPVAVSAAGAGLPSLLGDRPVATTPQPTPALQQQKQRRRTVGGAATDLQQQQQSPPQLPHQGSRNQRSSNAASRSISGPGSPIIGMTRSCNFLSPDPTSTTHLLDVSGGEHSDNEVKNRLSHSRSSRRELKFISNSDDEDAERERLFRISQEGRRKNARMAASASMHGSRSIADILAPKKVLSEEFETQVKKNLDDLKSRNSHFYQESVMEKHRRAQLDECSHLQQVGERGDERRDNADNYREKVKVDRKYQEKLDLAKLREATWSKILISVIFVRSAHHSLLKERALAIFRKWLPAILIRMLSVRNRKQKADEYTASQINVNTDRPTPQLLRDFKSGDFFEDWSHKDSQSLCEKMCPKAFREGDYIMYAGDYDRVLYILTSGSVDILIPKKTPGDKRRVSENSLAVITVHAPAYFGEFAILCKEPRSASIVCKEPCNVWFVKYEDFSQQYDSLSPEIRNKLDEVTDSRRRKNLKLYFPIRVEALQQHAFFAHWRTEELKKLINVAEPSVLREGTVIYKEGDIQPILYLLSDGSVRLTTSKNQQHKTVRKKGLTHEMKHFNQGAHHRTTANPNFALSPVPNAGPGSASATKHGYIPPSKNPTDPNEIVDYSGLPDNVLVDAGETFGEFEGFFNYQARRQTATTETSCDIWALKYEHLIDIGTLNAAELIASRKMVQDLRASRLIRPVAVPEFITADPCLRYSVPVGLQAWMWANATPRVYCQGEFIVKDGDEASELVAVVNGLVSLKFASAEWQEHGDSIEVDQLQAVLRPRRGAETHRKIEGPEGQTHFEHNIQVCFPHISHHYQSSAHSAMNRTTIGGSFDPHHHDVEDDLLGSTETSLPGRKNRLNPLNNSSSGSTAKGGSTTSGFLPSRLLGSGGPLSPHGTKPQLPSPTNGGGNGRDERPVVGFLLGAHELATRKSRHTCTLRAHSTVEVWVMDRHRLEGMMSTKLLSALDDTHSVQFLTRCLQEKKLLSIMTAHNSHHHHGGAQDTRSGLPAAGRAKSTKTQPHPHPSDHHQHIPPALLYPNGFRGASHDHDGDVAAASKQAKSTLTMGVGVASSGSVPRRRSPTGGTNSPQRKTTASPQRVQQQHATSSRPSISSALGSTTRSSSSMGK